MATARSGLAGTHRSSGRGPRHSPLVPWTHLHSDPAPG